MLELATPISAIYVTAALNISSMNHATYKAMERKVGIAIEKVAARSCLKAILAAKENALQGTRG